MKDPFGTLYYRYSLAPSAADLVKDMSDEDLRAIPSPVRDALLAASKADVALGEAILAAAGEGA